MGEPNGESRMEGVLCPSSDLGSKIGENGRFLLKLVHCWVLLRDGYFVGCTSTEKKTNNFMSDGVHN